MDIVIAIIAIVLAIYADKKKKQKKGQGQTVKPNVQNANRPNVQNANRPNVQTKMKNTVKTAQNTMQKNMTQTQRELKERLQQKHGNVSQQSKTVEQKPQQKKQEDILSRAAANVQEEAVDELRYEDSVMSETVVDTLQFGMTENSELMQQISDLMIMGYSGNLSFERDFVAEGVAMLNSCELAEY